MVAFEVCVFLSGDRYIGDGAAGRREILHDGKSIVQTGLLPILVTIFLAPPNARPKKGQVIGYKVFKQPFDRVSIRI